MTKNHHELLNVLNIPSPISEIDISSFVGFEKKIHLKRDDLIHPIISGNKWRKLKHNLRYAQSLAHDTILTFGGAYSNHIAATAYAAKVHGLNCIGVIRGEKVNNATLDFAKTNGMNLHFVSRDEYRLKKHSTYIHKLETKFGRFYLIPEGGANKLGVEGSKEIIEEVKKYNYDLIAIAAGTGTTAAGIISNQNNKSETLVFPALKGAGFLKDEIQNLSGNRLNNYQLVTDYHFGGYSKLNDQLIQFMKIFYEKTSIKLDQVYTAKMMYGLIDLIKSGEIQAKSKVLAVHTGGIQGNTAINFD